MLKAEGVWGRQCREAVTALQHSKRAAEATTDAQAPPGSTSQQQQQQPSDGSGIGQVHGPGRSSIVQLKFLYWPAITLGR